MNINKLSHEEVDAILDVEKPQGWQAWDWPRKTIGAQQSIMKRSGINPGEVDGFAGPQTSHALELYKASLKGPEALIKASTWRDDDPLPTKSKVILPTKSNWPKQDQASMIRYYGPMGANQTSIKTPFPLRIAWNKAQTVNKITVHEKVAESVSRVLARVASEFSGQERVKFGLDLFGGSLNVRKMRGGSAWSIHSWGCAIDFDPERNQLKWKRAKARLGQPDVFDRWFRLWMDEGWVGLGPARDYDYMHVQAARL